MIRQLVENMKKAAYFLSNPLVQYIPITMRTLGSSTDWSNPYNQPSPQFFIFQEAGALQSALDRYQVPVQATEGDNQLYVLALNFQAETILFRYLTCKIIGKVHVNSYHVFSMSKRYFPKRMLHFALFENDGTKIRWLNQEIY